MAKLRGEAGDVFGEGTDECVGGEAGGDDGGDAGHALHGGEVFVGPGELVVEDDGGHGPTLEGTPFYSVVDEGLDVAMAGIAVDSRADFVNGVVLAFEGLKEEAAAVEEGAGDIAFAVSLLRLSRECDEVLCGEESQGAADIDKLAEILVHHGAANLSGWKRIDAE